MMMDEIRTTHYRNAILNNRIDFQDKVVMDVGAGSGLLSIFAAQAGARKVYSVEASIMAESAKKLVESNGFSDIIEVLQQKIEDISTDQYFPFNLSLFTPCFLCSLTRKPEEMSRLLSFVGTPVLQYFHSQIHLSMVTYQLYKLCITDNANITTKCVFERFACVIFLHTDSEQHCNYTHQIANGCIYYTQSISITL